MAWSEDRPWKLEQGVDGRLELRLWANAERTAPWTFVGLTLYGFVSDAKRRQVYALNLSESNASTGSIIAILPEAVVNELKVTKSWFYNLLAVSPGSVLADDNHIAFGPAIPAFRPARRRA